MTVRGRPLHRSQDEHAYISEWKVYLNCLVVCASQGGLSVDRIIYSLSMSRHRHITVWQNCGAPRCAVS